jgi:hypothetical protein
MKPVFFLQPHSLRVGSGGVKHFSLRHPDSKKYLGVHTMKEKNKNCRLQVKAKVFSNTVFHCLFAALLFCFSPLGLNFGHAAEVTLSWDKNAEADVAGYKVFSGTSSGSYTNYIDVGNWTTCTISGLQEGKTYYYAAKAYNTAGQESGFSNEVSYTPIKAPVTSTVVSYTITGSSGTNGSISPSGSVSVSAGGSQTFIMTPKTGYRISGVWVDGIKKGTPTTYTFSNITANHSIKVLFRKK